MELFLDQDNYMLKKLSKKAGARMVVHDPYHYAYPDEDGVDMQPNTASSAAVHMNVISRLPAPYESNCTMFWNETQYEVAGDVEYSLTVNNVRFPPLRFRGRQILWSTKIFLVD